MKKNVIVFSGYNQRAVVAFLRTLEECKVRYAIVAFSKTDPILDTAYAKRVLAIRSQTQLSVNDLTSCIAKVKESLGNASYVLTPSTEALNRFLLDNRDIFEHLNCHVPLVDKTLYQQISDKYAFRNLCKKNGLKIPAEYSDIKELSPPFVAKPKKYQSRSGIVHNPVLVMSNKDKTDFNQNYDPNDFYYQEYINGESLYLLYFFYKNGDAVCFSQQNYIQQPHGKSVVAAISSIVHLEPIARKYEELFRKVNYFGLVMVEVKKDRGEYYMIEANPRFWGPSQLFVDAGVNLFKDYLYENGLIHQQPQHKAQATRYYWSGGVAQVEREGEQLVCHNYSKEQFLAEKQKWILSDVYNRGDTINIYEQEKKGK